MSSTPTVTWCRSHGYRCIMRVLPTGTVTFVFTDIEGSTSMLQRLGDDGFRIVLDVHNELIRSAFVAGVEIRSEGDAFFYVFDSASDALSGAIAAQQGLWGHPWPEGGTVRVRMGLHTGDGRHGGDDYVGIDVHRAARIAAAGHGGQILVSQTTKTLIGSTLADGASLQDLGVHRFKDIDTPERIFQAMVPGLMAEHPPVRSLDARPNNLPVQPSEFVGRLREAQGVVDLLRRARLVTLTGPGGAGKTRLAVHVASRVLGDYEGGVIYVPLDGARSADLVMPAIADQLRIDHDNNDPLAAVTARLRGQQTLVVLDNFEQVLGAAADVAKLLAGAPGVTVLVTSQALLRIRGEHTFPVPPLVDGDAVQLFEARAAAADPSFAVDETNRPAVVDLVEILDFMPLAIELAAARIRLFGVEDLRTRVEERIDLAGSGPADAPERHRTLHGAIQWSYDLLNEAEQMTLRHLALFDGGFVLDAAEQIVPPEIAAYAVEGVASLLDKSLLQRRVVRGEARFSILKAIRQFGVEQLHTCGEGEAAGARHSEYFADLADGALALLEGPTQDVWLDRFASEHDNIRAVVDRSLAAGTPDLAMRAVGGAWRFFHRRGHMPEAADWLRRLLDMPGTTPAARAAGLNGLAALVYWQGGYEEAKTRYIELLALSDEIGDLFRRAETLFGLSTTSSFLGELDEGHRFAELAKQAYTAAGAPDGVRRVTAAQSFATWMSGDLETAEQRWAEAEALYARVGDRAEQLQTHIAQAAIAHQRGRTDEALERLGQTLEAMLAIDDVSGTIMALDFMGAILAARDPRAGILLAAAATALRDELGGGLSPENVKLQTARELAAQVLEPAQLDTLWARGAALDFDAAVELGARASSAAGQSVRPVAGTGTETGGGSD